MLCKFLLAVYLVVISLQAFPADEEMTDNFAEWKKAEETEFDDYLSAEHRAFHESLKSDWQNVRTMMGVVQDTEPKLPVAPVKDTSIQPQSEVVISDEVPVINPDVQETDSIYQFQLPKNQLIVRYLGFQYRLPKIENWTSETIEPDNGVIASLWEDLVPNLPPIITLLKRQVVYQQLSDWAVVSLVRKYSKMNSNDENNSIFLTWSILLEMGYDARLAYDKEQLYLMVPSQQRVFLRHFSQIDGKPYYFVYAQPKGSILTYKQDFPGKRAFDFSFAKSFMPSKSAVMAKRTLVSKKNNIELEYLVYPELAEYYRAHPQLDFIWYFQHKSVTQNYLDLVKKFKEALKDKTEKEKVQILLTIVQYAYEYKLDPVQWGGEYYAPAEHMLMLKAADCEDRSFLLALLINQVAGVKTIGLHYPGHLAIASAVNEEIPGGKFYLVDNVKYYVTDPTYIGSKIGDEMPLFVRRPPKLIY